MATKKVEKNMYPKIIGKNGCFEYHFNVGRGKKDKVKDIVEVNKFSYGYAVIKLKGEDVYRYVDLCGNISEDSYAEARPYYCGRAVCRKTKKGPYQYREMDGSLSEQTFAKAQDYIEPDFDENGLVDGINPVPTKNNEYGMAHVELTNGKQAVINMLGEGADGNFTKQEVLSRGHQLYKYLHNLIGVEDLNIDDIKDKDFRKGVERILRCTNNIEILKCINNNGTNLKQLYDNKQKEIKSYRALAKDLGVVPTIF